MLLSKKLMVLNLQSFVKNNLTKLLVVVLLLPLMWLLGKDTSSNNPYYLDQVLRFNQSCMTSNIQSNKRFRFYSRDKAVGLGLLELFCQNSEVQKQFGVVEAFWGGGYSGIISKVGTGFVDLALMKENMMGALKATETHDYQIIATYPDYPVYLIALSEKPQLTKEYLLDKTFGLLNYPTSRSGHIIPKQTLTDLGLSLDKLDIVYASSHQELRDMLASAKVDIISSFWQLEDNQRFSKSYTTQLHSGISGSNWYLKMHKDNVLLMCATQRVLMQQAASQSSDYFSQLKVVSKGSCYEG